MAMSEYVHTLAAAYQPRVRLDTQQRLKREPALEHASISMDCPGYPDF
jgi:hypothetical protein